MSAAQIIQYEGDNSTFVWKHPTENFNTQTQLIVHESQEAIFFMNGQLLDVFGPGRHTLRTENIPLIRKFFGKVFGNDTPFRCEVYFINKTEQMAVKWGTDSKIEYVEPTYGFPVKIGASGEMTLRVADGKKLLVKVVGTEKSITQSGLVQKFRSFLMTKFKTYLSQYIRANKLDIFGIDERLSEISRDMQVLLKGDFEEYGISLVHFFVNTIVKPEDDSSYRRFRDLHFRQYADIAEAKLRQNVDIIDQETHKQKMIIEAEGLAAKRRLEGYTYQQERGFDVAQAAAENEAVGNMTNLGIGLGVMGGVGARVGAMVNDSVADAVRTQTAKCAKCGAVLPAGVKFCPECGTKYEACGDSNIICPKCGAKNNNGKFCSECGARLSVTCPECGRSAAAGTKFCSECGCRLEDE